MGWVRLNQIREILLFSTRRPHSKYHVHDIIPAHMRGDLKKKNFTILLTVHCVSVVEVMFAAHDSASLIRTYNIRLQPLQHMRATCARGCGWHNREDEVTRMFISTLSDLVWKTAYREHRASPSFHHRDTSVCIRAARNIYAQICSYSMRYSVLRALRIRIACLYSNF